MPDPNHQDVNPRDPKGGGGATLNPLRDHVQGEPEGGGKDEASPPASPPPQPQPQAQPPRHDDKSKTRR